MGVMYFIIGTIWAMWLEYYTTNNLEGDLGKQWAWRERVFHWFLWPVSMGTFILAIIDGFLEK